MLSTTCKWLNLAFLPRRSYCCFLLHSLQRKGVFINPWNRYPLPYWLLCLSLNSIDLASLSSLEMSAVVSTCEIDYLPVYPFASLTHPLHSDKHCTDNYDTLIGPRGYSWTFHSFLLLICLRGEIYEISMTFLMIPLTRGHEGGFCYFGRCVRQPQKTCFYARGHMRMSVLPWDPLLFT